MLYRTIGALIVGSIVFATPIKHFATLDTVSGVTITNKERITQGGKSKYLIWTETETFENSDSMLALKFSSSDLYGKLRIGAKCDLNVTGWRVPFFSEYRNILSVNCE